jgi:glycogen debranching enzyme
VLRARIGLLLTLAAARANDWRDEGPGRMLREAHTGPLEVLNVSPRARSYSSVTTSAFFPVVLAELWHWTGDRALVRQHLARSVAPRGRGASRSAT